MLQPWLEDPQLADRLDHYAEVTELDLRALGTTADAETIRDTRVAQPLIVAASLLSRHALGVPQQPDVTAGHSVGELAAVAIAGVLSEEDALRLVRDRGRAMAEAAGARATGMTAVVGGTPEEVEQTLERRGLVAANVNGGGQVVAAGTVEQLQALADDPPGRSRVIPLQVAGAFHTEHMAPAVEQVRATAAGLRAADPTVPVLSNANGAVMRTGPETLDRLVTQVANPVRWDLCCEQLLALGVTAAVELCPGGVLTGLARRTLPGVETVAVKGPEDLAAARDLISRHAGTGGAQ